MVQTHMVRDVSPIPPGRYWITVLGPNIPDFDAWIRDMHGAVRIEAASLDQSGPKRSQFLIFRVPEGRMPFLNAEQFGFPNTAPPEVTSVQDVEQSPIIKDPIEAVKDAAADAASAAGGGLFLLAVLALVAASR